MRVFGESAVFLDIDSIPRGDRDFVDFSREAIAEAKVVLPMIGNRWTGEPGTDRDICRKDDNVRVELDHAMELKKPIIPVYCDRDLLTSNELPAELQPLRRINSMKIDAGERFGADVLILQRSLYKVVFPTRIALCGPSRQPELDCPAVLDIALSSQGEVHTRDIPYPPPNGNRSASHRPRLVFWAYSAASRWSLRQRLAHSACQRVWD